MHRIARVRRRQGFQTTGFPHEPAVLPPRFRGLPVINGQADRKACEAAAQPCPTGAAQVDDRGLSIDLGKCVFCGSCAQGGEGAAAAMSPAFTLASSRREGLVLRAGEAPRVQALEARAQRLFGRALRLRQVSAGGCNGCEVEAAALQNVVFDFARFGIQFVASPRHADGLLVTGPVTRNMELALRKTYDAVPAPKLVIAVGACAISGGPFSGLPQVLGGAGAAVPVDLYIAGCPPHPLTMLEGLLQLLGRADGTAPR